MQLIKLILLTFCGTLLSASSTDSYEKVEVLKDNKMLQKTQGRQGQGVSYRDCAVEGRLTVNTPQLETSTTTGARPVGIEVAPREEFTEINHTVENRVEERSGKVQTALKPGFKAALGVGVAALSVASGGIGALTGASVASTLATTAVTSASMSFVNHGLESALNHESINLAKILKDACKSVAVAALTMGVGSVVGHALDAPLMQGSSMFHDLNQAQGASGMLARVSVGAISSGVVYKTMTLNHLLFQGLDELAKVGAQSMGSAYQDQALHPVIHKVLHGALAFGGNAARQALGGHMDAQQALVVAGAAMASETLAQNIGGNNKDAASRMRLASGLRVLQAAAFALSNHSSKVITEADDASSTALHHNFCVCFMVNDPSPEGENKGLQNLKDFAEYMKDSGLVPFVEAYNHVRQGRYGKAMLSGAVDVGVMASCASAAKSLTYLGPLAARTIQAGVLSFMAGQTLNQAVQGWQSEGWGGAFQNVMRDVNHHALSATLGAGFGVAWQAIRPTLPSVAGFVRGFSKSITTESSLMGQRMFKDLGRFDARFPRPFSMPQGLRQGLAFEGNFGPSSGTLLYKTGGSGTLPVKGAFQNIQDLKPVYSLKGQVPEAMFMPKSTQATYKEFTVNRYRDLVREDSRIYPNLHRPTIDNLDAHHMLADAYLQRTFSKPSQFAFPFGGDFSHMMEGVGAKDLRNAGLAVLLDSNRHTDIHKHLRVKGYQGSSVAPPHLSTRQVVAREHSALRSVGIQQGWYNPEHQLGILAAQKEGFFLNGYVVFPIAEKERILAMPFSKYEALHQSGTLEKTVEGAKGYWVEPVNTRPILKASEHPHPTPPGTVTRSGKPKTDLPAPVQTRYRGKKQEGAKDKERSLSPKRNKEED